MAHVEYLVHFAEITARSLLDQLKDHRRFKEVILDDAEISGQVFHAFGLTTTTAVDQSMDSLEMLPDQCFQQRRISSGRTEQ